MKEENTKIQLRKAKIIADYQFGAGAGEILIPDSVEFILSKANRIAQIKENGKKKV